MRFASAWQIGREADEFIEDSRKLRALWEGSGSGASISLLLNESP